MKRLITAFLLSIFMSSSEVAIALEIETKLGLGIAERVNENGTLFV